MFFKNKNTSVWIIFIGDIFITAFALLISYLLRFEFIIPKSEVQTFFRIYPFVILVRASLFFLFKIHRSILVYTSLKDALTIAKAVFLGSMVFALSNPIMFGISGYFMVPFSIIAIETVFTIFLMVGLRMSLRLLYNRLLSGSGETYQVAIYGATENGLMAKKAIERDAGTRFKVLFFLDDNPNNIGKKLEGIPVKKATELKSLFHQHRIKLVIFAYQQISSDKKQEIIDLCFANNCKVLTVPPVSNWINGQLSFKQIKKIDINDLLERDPIQLDTAMILQQLSGKKILITGAAGSIGSELVRQLLRFNPSGLILVDQAESALYDLQRELNELKSNLELTFIIGDITDERRMKQVFAKDNPQLVFHAAAYKHVPLMEENPYEAMRTNVIGTKLISDLAASSGVERFVMVSTDKAVKPTNVMGASKRIAEMYVQSLGQICETRFVTTRFGNVLGSNGSVIPIFRKQIEKGGPLTVTHPEITRYFMTIAEACQLVLEASAISNGGEIFIFDMGKSVRIVDLAKKMIKLYGLTEGKDIEIVYTGLRPGEKLYEELLNDHENNLPTHHPQIMRASIHTEAYEYINNLVNDLHEKILRQGADELELVKMMKEMVPDFISNNSVFELLDRK